MSSDYNWIEIKEYEEINGVRVPKDQYGHYLDWDYVSEDKCFARELTSPYGILFWAVGNAEGDEECDGDFTTFFDYAELPDGRIVLHAVHNTESGGYIGDGEYVVIDKESAANYACCMVDEALDAVDMNDLRHDTEGWNQDPYFFYRSVENYCNGGHGSHDVERITEEWAKS